jgi:hypothetical protein
MTVRKKLCGAAQGFLVVSLDESLAIVVKILSG